MVVAGGLSSCQDSYDAPGLQDPVATLKPNTTLMELKEMISSEAGSAANAAILAPTRDDGEHIIIHGRVISCDASGNIYQSLVIQDETTALNLSIRQANMWSWYREGQDVVIDVTGLYMGFYNGLYQLGWLGEYHEAASLTFMSWDMFREHSELDGLPTDDVVDLTFQDPWPADKPYCLVTNNIGEINSFAGGTAKIMSQLVEIQNVTWENAGVDTFAPYQESVNRTIIDSYGNSLTVRTSGYSNFYNTVLPLGQGNVRGILSYYNGWQLLLRDIDDVMFEDMGGATQQTALTVSEAINLENTGRNLWVKGYVVGSVKGNVTTIRSNDDIIFGKDADFPNTVVIADKANETNYQNCMVVELPMNTIIQEDVNLVDNPEVYGKLLYVKGGLNEYLGISGVTGANSEFYYDGLDTGGEEVTFLTSGFDDFTIDNVLLPSGSTYIWSWDATYTCVKASAFVGGANKACETYLISPLVKLSKRPQVTLEQALNFLNGNKMSDFIEICVREGETGAWETVTFSGTPSGTSWTFTNSTLDLSQYAGKSVQIGFHYKTTTACAPSWEIRNLTIK